MDSKAEYSALSSTRSQKKKKLKQTTPVPFNTVQVKIREGCPEEIKSDYGGKDL